MTPCMCPCVAHTSLQWFGPKRACLVELSALAATPACSLSTGSAAATASSALSAASACNEVPHCTCYHGVLTQHSHIMSPGSTCMERIPWRMKRERMCRHLLMTMRGTSIWPAVSSGIKRFCKHTDGWKQQIRN